MITITLPLRVMLCTAAALSLAILSSAGASKTMLAAASGAASSSVKPAGANKTLGDDCPASCGNLSIAYPFGIGPECSRGPDFRLICDGGATRSPKLFLRDGVTEVIRSIQVGSDGKEHDSYIAAYTYFTIETSIWRAIPMKSSVRVYNLSLEPPGRSFSTSFAFLNITGCDLDVYWLNQPMAGMAELACSTWCPSEEEITEMAARNNCSDMGCCRAAVAIGTIPQLSFVHRNSDIAAASGSNRTSRLRDRITVASDGGASLTWGIVDEANCASAKKKLATYACISNHSYCQDHVTASNGYFCRCEPGYRGNPFVLGGCTTDKGYNPKQSRADCTRQCGNISVPFPFGFEKGCFAREQFQLLCTNATSSTALEWQSSSVIDINVNEGIISYTQKMDAVYAFTGGRNLFVNHDLASSAQWVAANLSCTEAKQNASGYACVSSNSTCVEVNSVGYRCKCPNGFEGNPYVQSGCRDVDECRQPDICKGRVCNNIEGGFFCTECPRHTEFHPLKNQCARTKQQVLLTGVIIGLSGGFSILLLSFVVVFLFRGWKRNVQKQQRRNNFRKNQGILLEQLISPEKTNIFSLEELVKATNNFDPTRIIGHGGHGMVYKGILSDQRIVAIKKSKIIQYSEIKQFINEVAILSEINHRNVAKLFGCCLESEVPLLVYDYISSGSLSQVLHAESSNDVSLSWDDYMRIVTEAAGALSYLHSAASISILHRDVKSSNILLDGNYTAKVSDFGASRLVPLDQTHVLTNVQGTFGYLDPEYVQTRKLNEKSDVYSFGVVLLELLVRKKPVFTSGSGFIQNLSSYFLHALTVEEISDIVDSQVIREATKEEISRVASLAEMCLRLRGEERPTMKQVEMELQILRKKRLSPENELQNKTMLLTRRAEATCQSVATESGERVNLPLRHIQRCYSLEKEFMESATLPR